MDTTTHRTVLGVFASRDDAEEAIQQLESRGYNPKNMSILMKDHGKARVVSGDTDAGDVATGAVGGAGTGAILGGMAGLLASTVLPGIGGFFIGGPIGAALGLTGAAATTVSGAVTGAAAGGILGALTSTFHLSSEDAKLYESRINDGGILVAVPSGNDDQQDVRSIMDKNNADNIKVV